MQIAHDMLPDGLELVTRAAWTAGVLEPAEGTPISTSAPASFKHGPEFYSQAPKLKLVQTLSAGYNTYDLDAARGRRGADLQQRRRQRKPRWPSTRSC